MAEPVRMSLEARAKQIAEVATDAAFVGKPEARRKAVETAALDHLRAVRDLHAVEAEL